jgi:hypothetical protein
MKNDYQTSPQQQSVTRKLENVKQHSSSTSKIVCTAANRGYGPLEDESVALGCVRVIIDARDPI